MVYNRLHIIPISVFFLVVVTFIITYCIAVALEHVEAGFPYISETGTTPPESCVFAQFVNIAAAVLLMCVYVRYRQVKEISRLAGPKARVSPRVNKVAGYFGALSCLGLDMVANFQESNVVVVHLIGAFVCFAGGTVFFCMQTWISRRLRPEFNSNLTFYARAVISVLCVIFTFSTIIPAAIAIAQFTGKDKMRWQPEDGGWAWHLVSTASEWLLVICFCSFILSFSMEFRGITLEEPVIRSVSWKNRKYVETLNLLIAACLHSFAMCPVYRVCGYSMQLIRVAMIFKIEGMSSKSTLNTGESTRDEMS